MPSIYARDEIIELPNGQLVETDDGKVPFWFTRTGEIVRFSIFFGLFGIFLIWVIIGYWHAKRRISKGLAPLRYHKWLLSRDQRMRYDPTYVNPSSYYTPYQGTAINMQPMPPPMYDPNAPMPPTYQPPEGGSKVDPSQWRSQPTRRPTEGGDSAPQYEAPPGPPPAAVQQPNLTGSSNNPYRL